MPLATQTPPSIWPDFRLSVARLYLSLAFAFRCLSIVVVERREVATQIKIVIPIIEMFFYHLIVKGSSNIFIKERGEWVDLILTKLSRPPPVQSRTTAIHLP